MCQLTKQKKRHLRIAYSPSASLFERFRGQLNGVNVIPYTKGRSPQVGAHFTQYACRLLLIDGQLYSFQDLASHRGLNPLKIKVNTLVNRHRRGYALELMFEDSHTCRSFALRHSEKAALYRKKRPYRTPVKSHLDEENLSRFGSLANQRLNAFFAPTLTFKQENV